MLWLWWAIRRRGRYALGLMGAYDAYTRESTLHLRMTVDDVATSRVRSCLGLEERWRCRSLSRVTLAWNGFRCLASFFPSVPLLFALLPPSTLPISFLPLLTPILQIKPRTTPTNDANGPDVSRCRIRWGHGHVRHSSRTFPRAW